mgnify:CR=1 FL=1
MKRLLIILLSAPLLAFTIGDGHYFDIKKGNQKYEEGKYDEALKFYERARSQKESDVSRYDLGDAYYRKGDYDAAAENFSAMLDTKNAPLARQGFSNFAAANLMAGFKKADKGDAGAAVKNLKTAASAYRKILLDDPADKSAKENLEIALNKIKELEKQKKNRKPQDKKQKDKKQNKKDKAEQKKSGGEQNKKNKKQDEKGGKKNAKNEKGENEQKKQQSADAKQKGKMTPEEVERILKALAQNEKKLQKSLRQKRTRNYDVEKDW